MRNARTRSSNPRVNAIPCWAACRAAWSARAGSAGIETSTPPTRSFSLPVENARHSTAGGADTPTSVTCNSTTARPRNQV